MAPSATEFTLKDPGVMAELEGKIAAEGDEGA